MMKKVIAVCLILLSLSIIPVSARAGGGSSGGGGSGGSGSSSHHHSSQNSQDLPIVGCIGMSLVMGSIYYMRYMKNIDMHRHIKKPLQDACRQDDFWNEGQLKKKVEEAYYAIQEAWSEQDLKSLKGYLTEELYNQWEIKINWQIYRHERNVLEDICLISKRIVLMNDEDNNENDYFWVAVVGRMKDQIICNDEIQSMNHDTFVEYWKFKRRDDTILLDQILQEDEFNGGMHEDC